MIASTKNRTLPPRLGGSVTIIAEGRVNPGEVSRDGKAVVYGEFRPGQGEAVHRWKDGVSVQLNTDGHPAFRQDWDSLSTDTNGHSSYEARCNHDASVVSFNRYSIKDASDNSGNWDIARWEDGKTEVIASNIADESSADIDDSGNTIVYEMETPEDDKSVVRRWKNGKTEEISERGNLDWFPETSGNGERVIFRRDIHNFVLHDQNGTTKTLDVPGIEPAGVMLDYSGEKLLYTAEDEDGDQDLYLKDLNSDELTMVAELKGVDEYHGYISSDGETVVYTGVDRRKEKSDMNVYLWRDGESQQLSWSDGGLNAYPSVSADGNSVAWLWIDENDTANRKVLLWQKDQDKQN